MIKILLSLTSISLCEMSHRIIDTNLWSFYLFRFHELFFFKIRHTYEKTEIEKWVRSMQHEMWNMSNCYSIICLHSYSIKAQLKKGNRDSMSFFLQPSTLLLLIYLSCCSAILACNLAQMFLPVAGFCNLHHVHLWRWLIYNYI